MFEMCKYTDHTEVGTGASRSFLHVESLLILANSLTKLEVVVVAVAVTVVATSSVPV